MINLNNQMLNTGAGGVVGAGAGAGLGALFAKLMANKYPGLGYAIPMLGGAALGGLSGAAIGASSRPQLTPDELQYVLNNQGQY